MAKNRPLRATFRRLGRIDDIISDVIKDRGHADILEVGCGHGLAMLELKKLFPENITITGINKDARFNLPRRALWEGITKRCFFPWEFLIYEKRYGFPAYVNCDASLPLPFADSSFDLIYSTASTFFFLDKMHFLQDVNRILRPNCVARIHFSHSAVESGHHQNAPVPPHDNLCEIRGRDGKILNTEAFLRSHPFIQIVGQEGNQYQYLEMKKIHARIDFGLTLVESYFINKVNQTWIPYARSVYQLRGSWADGGPHPERGAFGSLAAADETAR